MVKYSFFGTVVDIPSVDEIVKSVVQPLSQHISSNMQNILNRTNLNTQILSNLITQSQAQFFASLSQLQNALQQSFNVNLNLIQTVNNNIVNLMQQTQQSFANLTNSMLSGMQAIGQGIGQGLGQGFANILQGLNLLSQALLSLPDTFASKISAAIDISRLRTELEKRIREAQEQLNKLLMTHSPESYEEWVNYALGFIAAINAIYVIINALIIAVESASLGQIDITLSKVLDTPALKSLWSAGEDLTRMLIRLNLQKEMEYALNAWKPIQIPSVTDLISFVVKECFPLDRLPAAPEQFTKYMRYHGFDEKWSKAYWEAHWRLPSPERVYEAFHRGILSEEEVKKYIVWHDYKPTKRPGIRISDVDLMLKLTYRLPTRTEARMMYEMGIISDSEIDEIVRAEGIDPKYRDKFKRFVKEFALRDDLRRLEREARYLFVQGKIDENQYKQYLTEARVPADWHDLFIKLARMEKLRKQREAAATEKSLTYSKISAAYQYNIIDDTEFINRVKELGFSDEDAQFLLAVEKRRKIDKMYDNYLERVDFLYLNDYITEDELRSQYRDLGYPEDQIDVIVQTLNLKKLPKRRYLTPTQVAKAFWRGLLTADEARNYLYNLGYRGKDIEILLMLYKPKSAAESESLVEVE